MVGKGFDLSGTEPSNGDLELKLVSDGFNREDADKRVVMDEAVMSILMSGCWEGKTAR